MRNFSHRNVALLPFLVFLLLFQTITIIGKVITVQELNFMISELVCCVREQGRNGGKVEIIINYAGFSLGEGLKVAINSTVTVPGTSFGMRNPSPLTNLPSFLYSISQGKGFSIADLL